MTQQLALAGRDSCVSVGHTPCLSPMLPIEMRAAAAHKASTPSKMPNCVLVSAWGSFDDVDTPRVYRRADEGPVRGAPGLTRIAADPLPADDRVDSKGRDTMIEVANLSKRFGSTLAVDGLSFTVQPGRVTGFLGPNGSGKSTTMRLILGLDAPDAGEARIGGRR